MSLKLMNKTRAAIYTRVSTDEQTTENQTPVLEQWCKAKGFDLTAVYSENASAWTAGHQSEFKRLLEFAHKRKFDVVLVWSLDRITREGSLRLLTILDQLHRAGVRVISYQEPWTDVPPEMADVLYALYGYMANFESRRRSERTKAGMARAKLTGTKSGKKIGRPRKKQ